MVSLLHVKHFSSGQISSTSVEGDIDNSVEAGVKYSLEDLTDSSVEGFIDIWEEDSITCSGNIVIDIIFLQFFVSSSNEYPAKQDIHFWEFSSSKCSEHVLLKW